jgi:hypothetical protein
LIMNLRSEGPQSNTERGKRLNSRVAIVNSSGIERSILRHIGGMTSITCHVTIVSRLSTLKSSRGKRDWCSREKVHMKECAIWRFFWTK